MRILVCGSRDYDRRDTLYATLDRLVIEQVDAIIEGEAKGADTLARQWAESRKVPVIKFPADWKKYGKSAGPLRNKQMLVEGKPDIVIAFPKGKLEDTRGTKNMVTQARAAGIACIVIEKEDRDENPLRRI